MNKLLPLQLLTQFKTLNVSNKNVVNICSRAASRICRENPGPRCPKRRDDQKCSKVVRKSDRKPPKDRPKTSMWVEPECCKVLKCDWEPRYDDMYWKESDKNRRQYQQTWNSCPEFKWVPSICEYDTVDPPPMEKRPKKVIIKLNDCPLKVQCVALDVPCPKITYDNCRKARKNVKCYRNKVPKVCKKFCSPQPAYSECRRKIIKHFKKSQCKCLDIPMICEIVEGAAAAVRTHPIKKCDGCNEL